MSQRLGYPAFDSALQQFLRGADELAWKSRDTSIAGATVVFDAAGEWVFYASIMFGDETFPVPHRLRLSSDGVNAAILCEGHPQASGLVVRGKGTWETVQSGAAVSVALTIEVHRSAAHASQPHRALEPEPEPESALNAAAVAATGAKATLVSTQDCNMVLKKDLKEATGLAALISRADAP